MQYALHIVKSRRSTARQTPIVLFVKGRRRATSVPFYGSRLWEVVLESGICSLLTAAGKTECETRWMCRYAAVLCGCILFLANARAQTDWPGFGHDPGSTKYSPLSQINTDNVSKLQVAWKFDTTAAVAPSPAAAPERSDAGRPDGAGSAEWRRLVHAFIARVRFTRPSESLPLVVNDVVYMSTGYQQVIALNAETGEKIWEYKVPILRRCGASAIGPVLRGMVRRSSMGRSMDSWSRSTRKPAINPRTSATEGW